MKIGLQMKRFGSVETNVIDEMEAVAALFIQHDLYCASKSCSILSDRQSGVCVSAPEVVWLSEI